MMMKLLVVGLVAVATAFPVAQVSMTQAEVDAIKNTAAGPARDALATNKVLPLLREFFGPQAKPLIKLDVTDVSLSGPIPDAEVDSSCGHKVDLHNGNADGTLLDSSYLQFGILNISWTEVTVFAEAEVDAQLAINTDMTLKVGAKVFGHCDKIAQKTFGVGIQSKGKNGIGLTFTAANATIEADPAGGIDLVFNFHAAVVGIVLDWDVNNIDVSKCKIEILGIQILSYCGFIEKLMKDGINNAIGKTEAVTAPALASKLETAINTIIGSTVRIPIKL